MKNLLLTTIVFLSIHCWAAKDAEIGAEVGNAISKFETYLNTIHTVDSSRKEKDLQEYRLAISDQVTQIKTLVDQAKLTIEQKKKFADQFNEILTNHLDQKVKCTSFFCSDVTLFSSFYKNLGTMFVLAPYFDSEKKARKMEQYLTAAAEYLQLPQQDIPNTEKCEIMAKINYPPGEEPDLLPELVANPDGSHFILGDYYSQDIRYLCSANDDSGTPIKLFGNFVQRVCKDNHRFSISMRHAVFINSKFQKSECPATAVAKPEPLPSNEAPAEKLDRKPAATKK